MPTLEWIGKEKVINHHQEVPFRVLERRYSFDENGQTEADNGSENMVIRGDNLEALKALLPRYEGRVKCIYIEIILAYLIQRAGIIKNAPLRCKNCSCGVNGKPGLPGCFYMEDDYEKGTHPEADCRLRTTLP